MVASADLDRPRRYGLVGDRHWFGSGTIYLHFVLIRLATRGEIKRLPHAFIALNKMKKSRCRGLFQCSTQSHAECERDT